MLRSRLSSPPRENGLRQPTSDGNPRFPPGVRRFFVALGLLAIGTLSAVGLYIGYVKSTDAWLIPTGRAAASEASGADPQSSLLLEHDFGIIRPNTSHSHWFTIQNRTDAPWTVDFIERSCNCTVARISERTVPAGGDVRAEITYTAGAKNRDDRRTLALHFREPEAPEVLFRISARVRNSLSLFPEALILAAVGRGESVEGHFLVGNYGQEPWEPPRVTSSADWLSIRAITPETKQGGLEEAIQTWRVHVKADAEGMEYGEQSAVVTVHAEEAAEQWSEDLSIRIDVQTPVAAIPGEFFFVGLKPGQPRSKTIMIRFAAANAPRTPDSVRLDHDLGDRLSLHWLKTSGEYWRLEAALTPRSSDNGFLTGTVALTFPGADLPALEIPVRGSIETATKQRETP